MAVRRIKAVRDRIVCAIVDAVTEHEVEGTDKVIHLARGVQQPYGYVLSIGPGVEEGTCKVGDLLLWRREEDAVAFDWGVVPTPAGPRKLRLLSLRAPQILGIVEGTADWELVERGSAWKVAGDGEAWRGSVEHPASPVPRPACGATEPEEGGR